MSFQKTGGLAALFCAATYVFGFVLLVTVLAPMGFGSGNVDPHAVVAFIEDGAGVLLLFNTVIYILNALALVVLVLALHQRLRPTSPAWAETARAFGLIWGTLVLGAGMLANVAVTEVAQIALTDPTGAAQFWQLLHSVELGLGGGNEIAGGVWIACVSAASLRAKGFEKITAIWGMITGLSGLMTLIPATNDLFGAIFGLGAILWFILIGTLLLRPIKVGAAPSRPTV